MCRDRNVKILTWRATRRRPFQSALRGAAPPGPTAAPGSEAISSFPPPCEGRGARSGWADICPPRPPDTG